MGMTGAGWSEKGQRAKQFFTEHAWSRTKEIKMAANVVFWNSYKSALLRSALQLPNISVSDSEEEFSTLLLSAEGLGSVNW